MIEITNLCKKYGKNQVLKDLHLSINKSGIFAILGPNGSGKTTLIKAILGMVIPNSGDITIFETPIKNNWQYRKNILYLPQIANFPANLRVIELIRMVKDLRQKESKHKKLVKMFQLEPFLDKKLTALSGGTKQKVNIILAFMFDSQLLILDEPTTGLDPTSLLRLKELIQREKNRGKTILITSHILQFVEQTADEIIYLLEGKIHFKGSSKKLLKLTGQNDFEYAIEKISKTTNYA